MNKTEVKEIIDSEVKKFISDSLDKEMKKILQNNNSASRKEIITTIKDAFEAVYKTLWTKKDFWKSDIR
jgi:hypothetical protein